MKNTIMALFAILAGVTLSFGAERTEKTRQFQEPVALKAPPKHGTEFIISIDADKSARATNAVGSLETAIRKRFSKLNYGIFWEALPDSRIRIVAPVVDTNQVGMINAFALRNPKLEFRLAHEHSLDLIRDGVTPAGYELFQKSETTIQGRAIQAPYFVKTNAEPGLSAENVARAVAQLDNIGRYEIYLEFDTDGAKAFERITTENSDHLLAIVVDGQLISVPRIKGPIEVGKCVIAGAFTEQQARTMASAFNSPLPLKVIVISSKTF